MTRSEATAEVFYTAFKALPKKERDAVLVLISKDKALREDLIDLAILEESRGEPSRPFRQFLGERKRA